MVSIIVNRCDGNEFDRRVGKVSIIRYARLTLILVENLNMDSDRIRPCKFRNYRYTTTYTVTGRYHLAARIHNTDFLLQPDASALFIVYFRFTLQAYTPVSSAVRTRSTLCIQVRLLGHYSL
jgi:hypothetical protein